MYIYVVYVCTQRNSTLRSLFAFFSSLIQHIQQIYKSVYFVYIYIHINKMNILNFIDELLDARYIYACMYICIQKINTAELTELNRIEYT